MPGCLKVAQGLLETSLRTSGSRGVSEIKRTNPSVIDEGPGQKGE